MMTFSDFEELRLRVLDPILDREQRLLAFWRLSAEHWRQRMARQTYAAANDDNEDADAINRRKCEDARKLRRIKKAIAAGSHRVRKITGTMVACDRADSFMNHICEACGHPFTPNKPYLGKGRPPMYCSPACKTAAWRARKAA